MSQSLGFVEEKKLQTPVVGSFDVMVAGGGPAGIAAALSAARAGAKTALVEMHGQLGGVWTSGALSWVIDVKGKGGIMSELIRRLDEKGAREGTGEGDFAYDVEIMKLVLEEMVSEAGIEVRLHTRIVSVVKDKKNGKAISHLITESKSGRESWAAKLFVDATGDGDLAALAGCGFDLGRPENGECQPMSLMAILTGIRGAEVEAFLANGTRSAGNPKFLLRDVMKLGGHSPSYASPTLFRIHEDLFALMANHEYGVSALDAGAITQATMRARKEIHQAVEALGKIGGAWKNLRVVATGSQIGVREGRRIHGRYTVSVDDLLNGTRHEDAACEATFSIDVHSTNPKMSRDFSPENRAVKAYDIPLRALIARDAENLFLAGRCISGDFLAHSSYRVTGNAVALGEAAGLAAAECAAKNIGTGALDGKQISKRLREIRKG
ncbi:MAG: FAD-dependent oxidoreductase [Spirochaetia bacterium]|nr:FAD-dependent oxidoreductase [Spirochaetia bacterium]